MGCKTMGGKREGSGRKKRFGDVPAKKVARVVPIDWIPEFDKLLAMLERQYRVHGVRQEHAN